MKIVNKKTGEVIDLSKPEASEYKKETPVAETTPSTTNYPATEKRIQERGTIQESLGKLKDPSFVKRITGGAEVLSSPLSAIESGISNPLLNIQSGKLNPAELVKQSILGVSLQRQGQYGDIMKNAGYNPLLADFFGLIASMSPLKVYQGISKTFGNISKMSDKGLMKAGTGLLEAANEARSVAGAKVGEEFGKYANKLGVDGLKFLDSVSDLPKPIMKKLEVAFGNMEDFAKGATIESLREFKRYLGKLKPNSFGLAEHGVQESLDIKDINKVYGKVKDLIKETMVDNKLEKKIIDHLMNLEDSFSTIMDARRFIKKSIVDPTLNVPSRVGSFAESVTKSADQTSRVALNEIKRVSSKTRNLVNKSMDEISSFEKWQAVKSIASHTVRAAMFGGVAGGIGGAILRKAQDVQTE